MSLSFRSLTGVLFLVAAATVSSSAAIAQPDPGSDVIGTGTTAETFNRAFFANDANFFRNRSIDRELNYIFGSGSLTRSTFLENEIARDGQAVDILYRDLLDQQTSGANGPIIRTPDLPNPYNGSLLQLPPLNRSSSEVGREMVLETSPSR